MISLLIPMLHNQSFLTLTTEFMLLAIAVVSFAIFLVMMTFKGKSTLDWFLAFRELVLFLVTFRLFLIVGGWWTSIPETQATVYTAMALVCLGVLVALIREHVFYEGAPSLRERWRRMREDDKPTV